MMIMMKSCFSGPFLLLFLCGTGSGLGTVVVKYYSYIQAHFTWHDAQIYCSSWGGDTNLATIFKESDESRLYLYSYQAWVGLRKELFYWKWPSGSTFYRYWYWAENEPHSSDACGSVYYNSKWFYGSNCEGHFFFFCENPGGGSKSEFVPLSRNWAEAQEHCTSQFKDLAYLADSADVAAATKEQDFPVWIGLHRDGPGGTWKWTSRLSEYRNWAPEQPSDRGDCVAVSSEDKKMSTQSCSARFPVVCFRDNLVLVKENKTWEEALEHCRGLRYDLVSVQPGDDHEYVTHKVKEAATEEVWSGLRFLAGEWLWVNTAAMLYSDLPLCPPMLQRCGALTKNDSLLIADCTEKRNFLCYS